MRNLLSDHLFVVEMAICPPPFKIVCLFFFFDPVCVYIIEAFKVFRFYAETTATGVPGNESHDEKHKPRPRIPVSRAHPFQVCLVPCENHHRVGTHHTLSVKR